MKRGLTTLHVHPIFVSGSIDFIDEGNVKALGNTGRYFVDDRHVSGTVDGTIDGTFFLTYDANVDLATQSGPLQGVIEFHDEVLDVTYSARLSARSEGELTSFEPGIGGVMELEIDGFLRFFDGAHGKAELDSWMQVDLDEAGHIESVLQSEFTIDGCWI